jgi:PAT family beta-lactamase induction signal transducer AmpG
VTDAPTTTRSPWLWVPSLYLAEGLPYVVVMTVSVIMYKRLGVSNTDIALYTSWLYLPWAVKPLWSPVVDVVSTKRRWVLGTQVAIAGALAAVAVAVPWTHFLLATLVVFALLAFASATHDIAADGFYMLGLTDSHQAAFVGVRSTFYRIAMITGQGALVVLAGQLEPSLGVSLSWSVTFLVLAGAFAVLAAYHRSALPRLASDAPAGREGHGDLWRGFVDTFALFFRRPDILPVLAFLLFYRFAEAQLVKLVAPFLLDARDKGGLGLTTSEVGVAYGTVGVLALVCGGLLGGYAISRKGLRWWLWPMVVTMHVPDLVFVYLSQAQPDGLVLISACVAVEQFGYGFGFTAYTMFMIHVAQGSHKTAHYAICTGLMALGMMLPGMLSGKVQEWLGYQGFFIWVLVSTIPGFIVPALVKVDGGRATAPVGR